MRSCVGTMKLKSFSLCHVWTIFLFKIQSQMGGFVSILASCGMKVKIFPDYSVRRSSFATKPPALHSHTCTLTQAAGGGSSCLQLSWVLGCSQFLLASVEGGEIPTVNTPPPPSAHRQVIRSSPPPPTTPGKTKFASLCLKDHSSFSLPTMDVDSIPPRLILEMEIYI